MFSRFVKVKIIAPIFVCLLTLLSHGINLFNYPYFENDEGVYTSQAWWLARFGKLAPYTYWYDHSPFGWIQIGLWQKLTGGPFTFGFSLFSTRIFMVLVTTVTNLFIYSLVIQLQEKKPRLSFWSAT